MLDVAITYMAVTWVTALIPMFAALVVAGVLMLRSGS